MRSETISLVFFTALIMSLAEATRAGEAYFEDFDSYEAGSNVIDQGDWIGWDGDPTPDFGGPLTDDFALSADNSLEVGGGDPANWTDVVWQFPDLVFGKCTFSAMTYIPSDSTSSTNPAINFMIGHPTPLAWGGEMRFFLDRGEIDYAGNPGNPVSMVRDEWVKIQLDVDLDTQQARMFYNDEPLGDFAWNGADFVAVDLWAPAGTSPMYYDDLSLVPSEICDNESDDDDDGLIDCADDDCPPCPAARFVRGDANSDGQINLTDGISILGHLFVGDAEPACFAAAKTTGSPGGLIITDAVFIFTWLFSGGDAPPPPTPSAATYLSADCGPDPLGEEGLGCLTPAAKCSQ
ncbi:MAG: hypothetical protein O6922_07865 [Chloroflexi bacterium]|nr:hypothetical protein [Chloroflexota bacterium]